MKLVKPRNIKTLNDNDMIYVSRSLINRVVADLLTTGKNEQGRIILYKIFSEAVKEEYETKQIIPYIEMSVKDIKICFPDYEKLPKGDFYK